LAELRERWIANAASLDRKGHFAEYAREQRKEVLAKGFLGQWRPDEALKIARNQVEHGFEFRTSQFTDDMRERGFVGVEVREALLNILDETPPESYRPPRLLGNPPGYPFIFRCRTTGGKVYFKLQIEGSRKKPRVLFWSCHPPVEETE
jgi:hypothetical protein